MKCEAKRNCDKAVIDKLKILSSFEPVEAGVRWRAIFPVLN
jgi:hypothetical protein